MTDLGTLGWASPTYSTAYAISDGGRVVGISDGVPVVWENGGIVPLAGRSEGGRAIDVNKSRWVLVRDPHQLWWNGSPTPLSFRPVALNDRGEVLGQRGEVWKSGQVRQLPARSALGPSFYDFGYDRFIDINGDGVAIGRFVLDFKNIGFQAFRTYGGGQLVLHSLGRWAEPSAMNRDGWMVGSFEGGYALVPPPTATQANHEMGLMMVWLSEVISNNGRHVDEGPYRLMKVLSRGQYGLHAGSREDALSKIHRVVTLVRRYIKADEIDERLADYVLSEAANLVEILD